MPQRVRRTGVIDFDLCLIPQCLLGPGRRTRQASHHVATATSSSQTEAASGSLSNPTRTPRLASHKVQRAELFHLWINSWRKKVGRDLQFVPKWTALHALQQDQRPEQLSAFFRMNESTAWGFTNASSEGHDATPFQRRRFIVSNRSGLLQTAALIWSGRWSRPARSLSTNRI